MTKVNAGNAKGTVVPSQAQVEHSPVNATVTEKPVEIQLDEVIDVDGEGEEEVEQAEETEAEEEEQVEEEDSQLEEDGPRYSCSPPPKSRKRPCGELNDEDEDAEGDLDDDTLARERARGGTPPKRARREGPGRILYSPVRMRKRGSEELELEGDEDGGGVGNKRIKICEELNEDAESPPTSITGTGESDSNSVTHAGDEEDGSESIAVHHRSHGRPPVSQADLDGLYVLGDD
jgi:hypothetical protein